MNEYTDHAVVDLDEAGSIIANKNIKIDYLNQKIAAAEARIAELETYLKSETKDKESAQESFGTIWSEWQRCEKRIAQLEEVLRLALGNLNWCEQAIADLRPQPYPLTLKDARDAINKINEVIG